MRMRLLQRSRSSTLLALTVVLSTVRATAANAQDTTRALTLGDVARLAAQRSATAVLSRLRADEVRSRVVQRKADVLPSLSAGFTDGERTYNTASFGIPFPGFSPTGQIIGPVRTIDVRARVAYNLFDPAALARYHGAQSSADSATAGQAAAAEQAAATAAQAYVRVLRAEAQVSARVADSALAAQLLSIARDQLAAGVGVVLDVTRAEAQVASGHGQSIGARNERDQARLALRRSLGMSPTGPLTLADSLPMSDAEFGLPDTVQALAIAVRQRPEVRAATAAVQSAQRARDAARAGRLPSVGLFADEGATSNQYNHLLQAYSYGFQLAVPVFEGRRVEGRVEEQTAVLREAELRLNDLRQQIELEVQSAVLNIASATEQVGATQERRHLAEQEVAQARERFTAGVSGNAEVIQALVALAGVRTQLIDSQAALRMAWLDFARAQGRLTQLP